MSSFICINCNHQVASTAPGTKNRNHCPNCLYSKHVDITPGDRSNACGGSMAPLGKVYKPDGEEVLIHQCSICGFIRKNRIAGDDDWDLVAKLPVLEHI